MFMRRRSHTLSSTLSKVGFPLLVCRNLVSTLCFVEVKLQNFVVIILILIRQQMNSPFSNIE